MKIIKIIFVLFSFLLQCACTANHQPGWATSVLDETVCRLPCWNGIMPGQTEIDDAVEIVEDLIDFRATIQVQTRSAYSFSRSYGWEFQDGSLGWLVTYPYEEEISSIRLESVKYLSVHLGELIDRFGEPDIVRADCIEGYCNVQIYYPSRGLIVQAESNRAAYDQNDGSIAITENLHVTGFFLVGENPFYLSEYDPYHVWAWKGYGNYP